MQGRILPLLSITLLAATGCRHRDPDPIALLQQTREAMFGIETVEYEFRYSGIGQQTADVDSMTGTALIERTDLTGSGYLLRLEAEVTPGDEDPQRILGIRRRDGTVYRWVRDTSTAEAGSIYGVGTVLTGWMRPALMYPFFDPAALDGDIEAETVVWDGTDEIEGETCDRIRVEFADDPERAEWCLGIEDHLPRRLAFLEDDSGTELEIFRVRTGLPVPETRFDLDPAADIDVVPVEYGLQPGTPIPPWTLQSPSGETVSLADLRGQVLVLDFWATWCAPCGQSMAAMERLAQALADQPVRFMAVNTMETADLAEVQRFLSDRRLTSELFVEGDVVHREATRGNLPAAVVIDRQGRFVGMALGYYGADSERYLEQLVQTGLTSD